MTVPGPAPPSGLAGPGWSGAVLTGGRSTRMGRDKATLEVHGTAMAARATAALAAAGAAEVFCVGGDLAALAGLGLRVHPDDQPGEGPLGGLVTALRLAARPIVMVLACDIANPDPDAIAAVVAALAASARLAAVPSASGRGQPLHAAYRIAAASSLRSAFDEGERSLVRAVARLEPLDVVVPDPAALGDSDTPDDLPARARGDDR